LHPQPRRRTLRLVPALLIGLALGVLFALPWIAAVVWASSRAGWRVLWSENGEEFPTQAASLRSFGRR
jgi:4-amino-4-deoxy-L-arabinose transferase-like glycosyltransferase